MEQTHYEQIVPQPVEYLATAGVTLDAVPVFGGVSYTPQFPVSAFQAGASLGRVAEINVTGTGATASVSGKRMTINVDKGVNARSVSPSVGAYLPVANIDFGAGFLTSFGANTVTVSTTAATPTIGLSNSGTGIGIVENPGAANSFTTRSISAGAGISVTQVGSNIQISSVAGAGLVGTNGNGLTVTYNTVALALATTSSAGAMAQLSGTGTDYYAGDGTFKPLPSAGVSSFNGATGAIQWVNGTNTTVVSLGGGQFRLDAVGGGGGAVTSVTSGNPTALTVSPTTGGVVVTPNGQSTTLGSAWNPTTRILSIPVGTYQGGILTSSTLNNFDLSVAATSNTVEVRKDGTVIGQAAILNFTGAGVTVTPGVGFEINIPGATGGGGIAGVSVNGVGTYTNLIFNGAGVSVSGNQVTVLGAGLVGTNGNGLVVGSNSVTMNLATVGSAGAMPALTGFPSQYLSGAGTWQIVPNLPSGNVNETLRHNGTTWEATTAVRAYANGDVVLGSNARFSIGNASNTFQFGSNFSTNVSDTFTVRFQTPASAYSPMPGMFTLIGGGSNSIVFQADLTQTKLGVFGTAPVARQTLPAAATDLASAITLLNALRQAEINYGWYQ